MVGKELHSIKKATEGISGVEGRGITKEAIKRLYWSNNKFTLMS